MIFYRCLLAFAIIFSQQQILCANISTVPNLIESNFNRGPADDFIRKIHTIDIPDAPWAYNASFIEYEEGFLMVFRYDTYKLPIPSNLPDFHNHVGLVQLDANFKPLKKWTFCKILGNRAYDPRIFRLGNKIYILYASSAHDAPHPWISSTLCLTEVQKVANEFQVGFPLALKVPSQNKWEKNWVPFIYQNSLALSYTINPHLVVKPSFEDGLCSSLSTTSSLPRLWKYGPIRGGTPAILVDGEYLAFFHSPTHSPIRGNCTYHMGAYTFQANVPFSLTKISPRPLSHPEFYTFKSPVNPSHVVFPAGIVIKDETIYVCYGENDACIKVIEIDKQGLYRSLTAIKAD